MRISDAFDLYAIRSLIRSTRRPSRRGVRGCEEKICFEYWDEAVGVAVRYKERVALQFGDFGPYWCRGHDSWHVGHRGKQDALLQAHGWGPLLANEEVA